MAAKKTGKGSQARGTERAGKRSATKTTTKSGAKAGAKKAASPRAGAKKAAPPKAGAKKASSPKAATQKTGARAGAKLAAKPPAKAGKPAAKSVAPARKPAAKRAAPARAAKAQGSLLDVARRALGARVAQWRSEGHIGTTPVSYSVEDGVLTYARAGSPRPIAPKDERLIARRFCPEHLAYLKLLDAAVKLIGAGAALDEKDAAGVSAAQYLADLAHPWIAAAAAAHEIVLPHARGSAPDPATLRNAAHGGDLKLLRAQLAAGVAASAADEHGFTALHLAAQGAFRECVLALLAAGADVNATTETGFNALHLVIKHTENRPLNVTATLTRDGKPVTLTDRDEIRAAVGSHPDDEYDDCVAIARALIDAGIDVEQRTSWGQTCLLHAASRGTTEITALILATGRADVNAHDKDGFTPLHFAARHGHDGPLGLLLAAKASPRVTESYGFTPLHEAAENDHAAIVTALLAAGADARAGLSRAYDRYPVGATARDVARIAGRKRALAALDAQSEGARGA